jgi:DNA (cytosine-5)-methyltransferase 1
VPATAHTLTIAGLFAGIGGIELGLTRADHACKLLCEVDKDAVEILNSRFFGTPRVDDIRTLEILPDVELVSAGFPCQDLSQVGRTAGINGDRSGLVTHVFDIIARSRRPPEWVLLENVPFMLHLNRGAAMHFLVGRLESLGYSWAYRTVDTHAFGLPQRRRRVFLLASRSEDPRSVLLSDDEGEPGRAWDGQAHCGFYWTEGNRGLGWAVNAVPPLKGGSGLGIPAAPAIWSPIDGMIGTPDIRDAERLQGFPENWTSPTSPDVPGSKQFRWRLVGNAVSVPIAEWLGHNLKCPRSYDGCRDRPMRSGSSWPAAGWGRNGDAYAAPVTAWPIHNEQPDLADFLAFPLQPLSKRATSGFLRRLQGSTLRVPYEFRCDLSQHIKRMTEKEWELTCR